jgi:hypothetical protein
VKRADRVRARAANPRQIIGSIFARAARQLAIGLTAGSAVAVLLDTASGGNLLAGQGVVFVPMVALLIAVVGLLAAAGPARRGLRIETNETLRAEG